MNAVTTSPKLQIIIPREVCNQVHLEAGQQMQIIAYNDRIELIPLHPTIRLHGFLKGIDTSIIPA